jgi:hypothetical protein
VRKFEDGAAARTVSKDTRVRMEGFVKIMAIVMPAKGL